MDMSG
jgi:hypothetical protein